MTWLRPQLHDGAIDEVVQPIVREERLRLGDLHFVCAALPDTFVVSRDCIFERSAPAPHALQRFDEAMRGVEGIVGALPTMKGHSVRSIAAQRHSSILVVPRNRFPYLELIA